MLVVNLVEGQVLHDAFHVEELHHEHPVVLQPLADRARAALVASAQLRERQSCAGLEHAGEDVGP